MSTVIDHLKIEVFAKGEILAGIEENAENSAAHTQSDTYPDPVKLFAKFINAGFAVSSGNQHAKPSVAIDAIEPDMSAFTQRWRLTVHFLDAGYLVLIDNLLRAPGVGSVSFSVLEDADSYRTGQSLDVREFHYPKLAVKLPFAVEYTPPPEDVRMRSRTVQIEFGHHLGKNEARGYCETLEVWSELVSRSGFCPRDADPSEAGAMPSLAFQYDPQTIEVGFDEFVVIDEACFVSLVAYVINIQRAQAGIGLVRIA